MSCGCSINFGRVRRLVCPECTLPWGGRVAVGAETKREKGRVVRARFILGVHGEVSSTGGGGA